MSIGLSGRRVSKSSKLLISRILEREAALGLSHAEVSRKAGLGETAVYDIVKSKNQNPSLPVVKAIAAVLQCTVSYLAGETDRPGNEQEYRGTASIPIIGIAETGAFRQMADFDQSEEKAPKITGPISREHPRAKHFALKIRGDSMNAAKPYPLVEGLVVLCVDVIHAELEVESGRVYAVRRTLDGGQTFECTVKRAKVFRNRFELHPESTNSAHQPLIIPRGAGKDDEFKEIAVIGLVYGVLFEGEI